MVNVTLTILLRLCHRKNNLLAAERIADDIIHLELSLLLETPNDVSNSNALWA